MKFKQDLQLVSEVELHYKLRGLVTTNNTEVTYTTNSSVT